MSDISFREAINEAMHEEMLRDETVLLLGENISVDIWGTSGGLYERFGKERVRDTPISEQAIVGTCVGAALADYRPVGHMMVADFFECAGDEILGKAARWHFSHGGKVTLPLTLRAAIGGYSGIGPDHSKCMESFILRAPGLKLAIPSTPYDAKGLLKAAIRDNNPVVYLEHKSLLGVVGSVPEEDYTVPLGVADIKREGDEVTVVATGYMVKLALQVAEILRAEKGLSIEVIDPRTLEPLDMDTIIRSVKKTHRIVIVDEDTLRCGPHAEIGMLIMEEAFDYLDAPVKRIGAANYPIAAGYLEQFILPNPQQIVDGILEVLGVEEVFDLAGRVATSGKSH